MTKPEKRDVQIALRAPRRLRDRIFKLAREQQRTASSYILILLENGVREAEAKSSNR